MVSISLCMIVRNEEAVLARALDSVKDVVDEIIIVDTGSDDATKEIAGRYTDKIYDFVWINDFSAARNESFSKAIMDYCMWMDADDILPASEQDKFLDWKSTVDRRSMPDVVMFKYATGFDSRQHPTFLYYRERLLRRDRGFYWQGRVHECITPKGTIQHLDIYLAHHSNKTSYSKRNLDIYESMRTSGETLCARDLFYYARELYYHERYQDAINHFNVFLNSPNGFVENQVEACRIASYCCYFLKDEKGALDFLLKGLAYRVPGGELCCDLGKHFLDRGNYEQACFWYQAALHTSPQTENGGFVTPECYGYLPCLQLSVCYDKLGDTEHAVKYHKLAGMHNPTGELYLHNNAYFVQKEKELKFGTFF